MGDVDALLSRFIEEWNAGRRPSVEGYLDQASEGAARDDLADQISTFLTYAPTPPYDEAAMAQLLDEPAVLAAAAAFESEGSAWRALLPRLRTRAGLSPSELAAEVLDAAGLGGEGRDKAARHLDAMERGELDAGGVSDRLLAALSRVLRINHSDLVRTGMPGAGPAPAGAMFRREAGEGEDLVAGLDLAADALSTPAPDIERDEVDELFFGPHSVEAPTSRITFDTPVSFYESAPDVLLVRAIDAGLIDADRVPRNWEPPWRQVVETGGTVRDLRNAIYEFSRQRFPQRPKRDHGDGPA
jgi:hypothetical protein